MSEDERDIFLREYAPGLQFVRLDRDLSHREVTSDVGRRCAYANMLTNHLITDECSIACLDITDWGVWPSSQNMDLFNAYRRSLGESRLLHEAHFHVFQANEANEFRNVLHLALISLFDVAGASTPTDFRFYASHDEWIDVAWQDGAPWQETMKWFFE
jgi:hypothetical protein